MMTEEQNELLTRTGPGTPCGEMLRRYWLPVGIAEETTKGGKPREVRVMGEDLVLFRDDRGRPGLLGLKCSHRLTSLAYGRVEDGGIRCAFHGWLYDVEGRCLEQPAEPEPFTDKIHHLSYPCRELGGLIFAYLGPKEKMPLLPRYEVLVREDGTRKADGYVINSNYLQNVEGAVDTVHFSYLHMDRWSKVKHKLSTLPKPNIEFRETEYGIWQKSLLPDVSREVTQVVYAHFFMPNGFMRIQESLKRNVGVQKFQSWYVPIDDERTMRFQVGFTPRGKDGKLYEWPSKQHAAEPGPENEYFRDYESIDTISGIPVNAPGTAVKGFLAQDNMVNESQGIIVDRRREHLGAFDKVLSVMRLMYLLAVDDVRKGKDPKHIIRDATKNEMVRIAGDEEQEAV